jgi:hypothetical protein
MVNVIKGTKGFVSRPVADRFWEKVFVAGPDECWEWEGSTNHHPDRKCAYGMIWHNGRNRKATHVSWELANGAPVPKGKMICHTCDNPTCVNPAHLWPGTMSENITDAVRKGRVDMSKARAALQKDAE